MLLYCPNRQNDKSIFFGNLSHLKFTKAREETTIPSLALIAMECQAEHLLVYFEKDPNLWKMGSFCFSILKN
jgi:hypothetical protein